MTHVPYRATPQQLTDIAAGNVDIGFVEAGASRGLIHEGKLRALAVSSSTRFPLYPDVPTLEEAFDAPGLEAVSWHVLMAPAATPRPIVDRLHAEMKKITSTPEFKKTASDIGLIPIDTPDIDGVRDFIKSEQDKWGNLVRKIGLAGSQ
jgi:tripartite-type tricarboxylate transporter receptor subunit TctC